MSTRDGTEMFVKLREGKLSVVKPNIMSEAALKKRKPRVNEEAFIAGYADKYNERFKKLTGGHYVGRLHIERMLVNFLRAHKRRKRDERST